MSMTGHLRTLDGEDLDLLQRDPSQVEQFVDEGKNGLISNIRLLSENFDQLRERIKELHAKAFYAKAAKRQHGMLLYLA